MSLLILRKNTITKTSEEGTMQDTADRVHISTTQLLIDIKLNDICLHQIFVYFKSDKIISKSAGSNIRKMC